MIAPADNFDRVSTARRRLNQLKSRGFKYIVTVDDGESWIGSHDSGLEIDDIITSHFMGEIMVESA